MLFLIICYETFLTEITYNIWWLDSDAIIHIFNTIQGFLIIKKSWTMERIMVLGNRLKDEVKVIGTFRLLLDTYFSLNLHKICYVSTFS